MAHHLFPVSQPRRTHLFVDLRPGSLRLRHETGNGRQLWVGVPHYVDIDPATESRISLCPKTHTHRCGFPAEPTKPTPVCVGLRPDISFSLLDLSVSVAGRISISLSGVRRWLGSSRRGDVAGGPAEVMCSVGSRRRGTN
jgi:hypothetical protein